VTPWNLVDVNVGLCLPDGTASRGMCEGSSKRTPRMNGKERRARKKERKEEERKKERKKELASESALNVTSLTCSFSKFVFIPAKSLYVNREPCSSLRYVRSKLGLS